MEKRIVVKFSIDGIHQWKDCSIKEVSFLTYPHRHMFKVRMEKKVTHNDRELEIIKFKHSVLTYLKLTYFDDEKQSHIFGNMSCESIAEELMKKFNADLVEVLEDNENGAIIRL